MVWELGEVVFQPGIPVLVWGKSFTNDTGLQPRFGWARKEGGGQAVDFNAFGLCVSFFWIVAVLVSLNLPQVTPFSFSCHKWLTVF